MTIKKKFQALAVTAMATALLMAPMAARALEDTLVIVTSYPPDTTVTVKQAFEKAYPGVKVEMLEKKTTAGIKYLQETAKNNTSDMFWASAPDAFEVLKGDKLLQKYEVKVKGIPEKVGAFPINDPDGYYKGFAASGYGIMWNTGDLKAKHLPVPKRWADSAESGLLRPRRHERAFAIRHHAPDRRDRASGRWLGRGMAAVEGDRR